MKNVLLMIIFSFLIGMTGCGSNVTNQQDDPSRSPKLLLTSEECKAKDGKTFFSQAGEQMSCPTGNKLIGELKAQFEGGVCCEYPLFTVKECEDKGAKVLSDPGDGSLKNCENFYDKIGNISGLIEGGICCMPLQW